MSNAALPARDNLETTSESRIQAPVEVRWALKLLWLGLAGTQFCRPIFALPYFGPSVVSPDIIAPDDLIFQNENKSFAPFSISFISP